MSVLIPDKMKQMGIDKNYKLIDAVDVELNSDDYTDVQDFVDNFSDKLTGFVEFKRDSSGNPELGTNGQFAITNGDGTISFTSTTSSVDPDLIAPNGTKFRFGYDTVSGAYGYIITNTETGNDQFIPFKTGDGGGGSSFIISSYKIKWSAHTIKRYIVLEPRSVVIGSYIDKTILEDD